MAVLSPTPRLSSYVPSKFAIAKIHEILQVEHLELHVVIVHPGAVETAMIEQVGVPV
jgi:short-subunit dehydrogenase